MGGRGILAALLCLAVSGTIYEASAAEKGDGQPVVTGQQTGQSQVWTDGSSWHLVGTTNDGPNVTISNPPQGWIYYYPSIMQQSKRPNGPFLTTTGAGTDSSAAYEATGAYHWIAMIYPTFDDSTVAVVAAYSVRNHPIQAADSLSTYSLLSRTRSAITTAQSIAVAGVLAASGNTNLHTAAAAASLGLFSSVPVGASVTGTGIDAGSVVTAKGTGDSTITISKGTTAAFAASTINFWVPPSNSASDSLGTLTMMNQGIAYTDTLAMPDEQVFVLQNSPTPRGRAIMFDFTGSFISMRLRLLNVVTAGAQGLAFCARDPLTSYKIDLYGYR